LSQKINLIKAEWLQMIKTDRVIGSVSAEKVFAKAPVPPTFPPFLPGALLFPADIRRNQVQRNLLPESAFKMADNKSTRRCED
jgi:hypothetical protein